MTFGYGLESHGRFAFLDEMYIRDEYRGRGLGREALEAVEETCRRRRVLRSCGSKSSSQICTRSRCTARRDFNPTTAA